MKNGQNKSYNSPVPPSIRTYARKPNTTRNCLKFNFGFALYDLYLNVSPKADELRI